MPISLTTNRFMIRDPQRIYKWELLMPADLQDRIDQRTTSGKTTGRALADRILSKVTANTGLSTNDIAHRARQFLDPIQVQSVSYPITSIEPEGWIKEGKELKFATNVETTDTLDIEIIETSDSAVLKMLVGWKSLIRNDGSIKNLPEGTFNYPIGVDGSGYKNTIILRLLSELNIVHTEIEFQGAWPTLTSKPTVSYAESGALRYIQSFSVDKVVYKFKGLVGQFIDDPTFILPGNITNLVSILDRDLV